LKNFPLILRISNWKIYLKSLCRSRLIFGEIFRTPRKMKNAPSRTDKLFKTILDIFDDLAPSMKIRFTEVTIKLVQSGHRYMWIFPYLILIPSINFINILIRAFFVLILMVHFGFDEKISAKKALSYENRLRKILMKLTIDN